MKTKYYYYSSRFTKFTTFGFTISILSSLIIIRALQLDALSDNFLYYHIQLQFCSKSDSLAIESLNNIEIALISLQKSISEYQILLTNDDSRLKSKLEIQISTDIDYLYAFLDQLKVSNFVRIKRKRVADKLNNLAKGFDGSRLK